MLLQTLNIDSIRRVLTDSILIAQKQQLASIDYVSKVDSFYNSAWTKLSILFALVGVITPLFINYLQTKRNEKDKQLLKDEIKSELQEEIMQFLEKEINTIQHASEGVSYHIQADILFRDNKFKEAFGEYINTLTCYFIGDDFDNFKNVFPDLTTCFSKITKKDIIAIKTTESDYYNVEELLDRLKQSKRAEYKPFIEQLKIGIEGLT